MDAALIWDGNVNQGILMKSKKIKMNKDDLNKSSLSKYIQKCKWCGVDLEVFTQKDEDPEYYTNIYIICMCGECVHFRLPVN